MTVNGSDALTSRKVLTAVLIELNSVRWNVADQWVLWFAGEALKGRLVDAGVED
jgi:hypothetical protein